MLVLPIVVYHGDGKWKKRSFASHFELPDERFERFLPSFDYELIDLRDVAGNLIINQTAGLYVLSF